MGGVPAGLMILVIDDSHMSSPVNMIASLHNSPTAEGAVVNTLRPTGRVVDRR